MGKHNNKMQTIEHLISELNSKRNKESKPLVKRAWTGIGHWLATEEQHPSSVGGIYTSDDGFIGFLEGLLYQEK